MRNVLKGSSFTVTFSTQFIIYFKQILQLGQKFMYTTQFKNAAQFYLKLGYNMFENNNPTQLVNLLEMYFKTAFATHFDAHGEKIRNSSCNVTTCKVRKSTSKIKCNIQFHEFEKSSSEIFLKIRSKIYLEFYFTKLECKLIFIQI